MTFNLHYLLIFYLFGFCFNDKPTQIHMAAGPDASTQMVISWVTASNVSQEVIFSEDSNFLNEKSKVGYSTSYEFPSVTPIYSSGIIHHVFLSNLKPKTNYYYQCGDSNDEMSDIYSFTTLPIIGDSTPLTFTVVGDLGTTIHSVKTTTHMSRDNSSMILHCGDLSYANCEQDIWDEYGNMVQFLSSTIPWMTIPGNHEIEVDPENLSTFLSYSKRYIMPGINNWPNENNEFKLNSNGNIINNDDIDSYSCTPSVYMTDYNYGSSFYSINVGLTHFIFLNSYSETNTTSEQYNWLLNDLELVNRKQTPWIIVLTHCPLYSSNAYHQSESQTIDMKNNFEYLFYYYKINLILSGHVHAYERTYNVYDNEINNNGPIYITIGDGGNQEGHANEWETQPDWSAFRNGTQYGHGTLIIENENEIKWEWNRNSDIDKIYRDKIVIKNFNL